MTGRAERRELETLASRVISGNLTTSRQELTARFADYVCLCHGLGQLESTRLDHYVNACPNLKEFVSMGTDLSVPLCFAMHEKKDQDERSCIVNIVKSSFFAGTFDESISDHIVELVLNGSGPEFLNNCLPRVAPKRWSLSRTTQRLRE